MGRSSRDPGQHRCFKHGVRETRGRCQLISTMTTSLLLRKPQAWTAFKAKFTRGLSLPNPPGLHSYTDRKGVMVQMGLPCCLGIMSHNNENLWAVSGHLLDTPAKCDEQDNGSNATLEGGFHSTRDRGTSGIFGNGHQVVEFHR